MGQYTDSEVPFPLLLPKEKREYTTKDIKVEYYTERTKTKQVFNGQALQEVTETEREKDHVMLKELDDNPKITGFHIKEALDKAEREFSPKDNINFDTTAATTQECKLPFQQFPKSLSGAPLEHWNAVIDSESIDINQATVRDWIVVVGNWIAKVLGETNIVGKEKKYIKARDMLSNLEMRDYTGSIQRISAGLKYCATKEQYESETGKNLTSYHELR